MGFLERLSRKTSEKAADRAADKIVNKIFGKKEEKVEQEAAPVQEAPVESPEVEEPEVQELTPEQQQAIAQAQAWNSLPNSSRPSHRHRPHLWERHRMQWASHTTPRDAPNARPSASMHPPPVLTAVRTSKP